MVKLYSGILFPAGVLCFAAMLSIAAEIAPTVVRDTTPPTAPDLVWPVNVSTNNGQKVYQFGMHPVITNMVVASNDLVKLQADLKQITDQMSAMTETGKTTRSSIETDFRAMVGIATNYATQNPEGKKLHERITALEAELNTLNQEMQNKLNEEQAYREAKTRMEAARSAYKTVNENVAELRKKKADASTRVWQLQTMIDQTRQAEEAALKAKEKKTEKPSP